MDRAGMDPSAVEDICDTLNSPARSALALPHVCVESYEVSKHNFHKLMAQSYPDGLISYIDQTYVFVNTKDDTVLVDLEGFGDLRQSKVLSSLEGIKRLAICDDAAFLAPRQFLNIVDKLCFSVEFLTLCNLSDSFFDDLGYDYQLVGLPNSSCLEDFHSIVRADLLVVTAEEELFKKGLKELNECGTGIESQLARMQGLRFDVAYMARRRHGGQFWTLGYMDQLGNDSDHHNHWEPIALVSGQYTPSFRPLNADTEIVPHQDFCVECKSQRWAYLPEDMTTIWAQGGEVGGDEAGHMENEGEVW
jgi:hypothetical protein